MAEASRRAASSQSQLRTDGQVEEQLPAYNDRWRDRYCGSTFYFGPVDPSHDPPPKYPEAVHTEMVCPRHPEVAIPQAPGSSSR